MTFGECGDYPGGYFAMAECDEDSGAISASLYRGDGETANCDDDLLVIAVDDIFDSGSCTDSKIQRCTTTGDKKMFCSYFCQPSSSNIFKDDTHHAGFQRLDKRLYFHREPVGASRGQSEPFER